jgi:hypothetical protein
LAPAQESEPGESITTSPRRKFAGAVAMPGAGIDLSAVSLKKTNKAFK